MSSTSPPPSAPPQRPRAIFDIPSTGVQWRVERVARTGSTSTDLLVRFASPDAPIKPLLRALASPLDWQAAQALFTPVVRVAAEQSAGRGRQGRRWTSAPGKSLLFSIGVVLPMPLAALAGLSLAAGTAVLTALRQLPLTDPSRLALKWPNDIELDEAKLGGILIETAATAPHACAVVIGIGLNLRGTPILPATDPSESTSGSAAVAPPARPAASLSALLPSDPFGVSRDSGATDAAAPDLLAEQTLQAILAAFAVMFERFCRGGFRAFREQWWQSHRMAGQWVRILDGGKETLRGRAVGVDDGGRLLVETADRPGHPQAVATGDVSLRPVETPASVGAPSPVEAPAPGDHATRASGDTTPSPVLLIDAGNSRVKWACLLPDGQRISGGPVDRELNREAEAQLIDAWRTLPAPRAIWMSNVAGEKVTQRLSALLASRWPGVPLNRIRSQPQQCGVTNHYRDPSALGSDRWAGLIGARAAYPGEALLIATLGTATTVDAMDQTGHFLGGMIAPGWSLMMRSLGEHTAQLPSLSADDAAVFLDARDSGETRFATATAEALVEGCRAAQAGVILSAWHALSARLGQPVRCIVGGGAAARVALALSIPITRHDDLALEGLAHIALDDAGAAI